MKKFIRVANIVVLVALAAVLTTAGGRPDTVKTVFTVEGMHCDGCSSAISASLEKVDGVKGVAADHELGVAEVTYHPRKVEIETLTTEIEKLGYSVTGVQTEAGED